MTNLEEYYDYIDQSKKEGNQEGLEQLKDLVNAEKQGNPEESGQYEMVLKSIDRALESLGSKLEEATEIPGFQQEEIGRLQAEGAEADAEAFKEQVAGLDAEGVSLQEQMTGEFEEVMEEVKQEYKGGELQEPEALFNERMRRIKEVHEEQENVQKESIIADAFEKSKGFAQEQFVRDFYEAKEDTDAYIQKVMSQSYVEAPWIGIRTLYTLHKKGLLSEEKFNQVVESQKKKFVEAYISGNKFLEGVSEDELSKMADREHKRVLDSYKTEAEKMMEDVADYINLENVESSVSSWEEYRIQNRGEIDKFNQQLMQRIDQENDNFKHPQTGGPGSGMWVGYLFEGYLRNPNIPVEDIEKFVDWYLFKLKHPKLSEGFKDVPREKLDKYLSESGQIKVMKELLARELERSGKFDNYPDKLNELKNKIQI